MDAPSPTPPQALQQGQAHTVSDGQLRYATLLGVALVVSGVLLTPFASQPWLPVPGYMTAFGAAMVVTNVLLATLLFNRGAAERNAGTVKLGAAYLFVALIFIPLMLAFPDSFVPGNVIGEPVSAVWLWSFWHAGFALMILRYALHMHRMAGRRVRHPWPHREFLALLAAVCLLTLVATAGQSWLPPLLVNGKTFFEGNMRFIAWTVLGVNVAALVSVLRIRDKTSEQVWLAVGMIAACSDVWLTFHGSNRFAMGWYLAKLGSLFTSMVVLTSLFVDLTSLYRRVTMANSMLSQLASRDGLTGLANRRTFDEVLQVEWRRAQRLQQPLSLLMLDVDHFKLYNDTFGHLGGDDCLRSLARTIAEHVARPGDLAARYGGEEFALILPNTDVAGAQSLASRIHASVAQLGMVHPRAPTQRVTVSLGLATLMPDATQSAPMLVSLADQALYQAKSLGRDRVQVAAVSLASSQQALQA